MGITDWRLGRLVRTQLTAFDSTAATNITFTANMQRVGISFLPGFMSATLTTAALIIIDDNFQVGITSAMDGYTFTLEEHGDLPTHKFRIQKQNANIIFTIIEYFMPEEYLIAALNAYKAQNGIWKDISYSPPVASKSYD